MTGLDITKKWLASSATATDLMRKENGGSDFKNQRSLDKARNLRQSSKVSFELSHPTPLQVHDRDGKKD